MRLISLTGGIVVLLIVLGAIANLQGNYHVSAQSAHPTASPVSATEEELRDAGDTLTTEALLEAAEAEYAMVQEGQQEPDIALLGVADVKVFYWRQDNATPTRMIRSSDGICLLRSVQGRFRGDGEKVAIANRGGYWWLEGKSKQTGIVAASTCVPFSAIKRSHSLIYSIKPAFVWFRAGDCPPRIACGRPTGHEVVLGSATDFCYLTGMGGHFRGGGEWVGINERNGRWYLQVNTKIERAYIRAEAGCISFAGDRSQYVTGPHTWVRGASRVNIADADIAFCGLSQIQGSYQSGGDQAYIYEARRSITKSDLYVFGHTNSNHNNRVTARCYSFDQRLNTSPVTPIPTPTLTRRFRVYSPLILSNSGFSAD
jgi:hypothetical protein